MGPICIFCGGVEFVFGGFVIGAIWLCRKIRQWLGHSVDKEHICPSCFCNKHSKKLMVLASLLFMAVLHLLALWMFDYHWFFEGHHH
jgi:hypothetical protein